MKTVLHSFRLLLTMTVLVGLLYPLFMTLAAQTLLPAQANGSLVRGSSGAVLGSTLIGQDWADPKWFQGRPSATGGQPYNAQASGGSNLSPHGKALADRRFAARTAWEERARAAGQNAPVPDALLSASGSGLDPHLDLDAALWQAPLVAAARGLDPDKVTALVKAQVVPTGWPWDPAPYVNLLALNQALEQALTTP